MCARAPPPPHSPSELRAGRDGLDRAHRLPSLPHVSAGFPPRSPTAPRLLSDAGCAPCPRRDRTRDGRAMDGVGSRCKIVVVGDTQCGKTALLHVFAKDCYPEVNLQKESRISLFSVFLALSVWRQEPERSELPRALSRFGPPVKTGRTNQERRLSC